MAILGKLFGKKGNAGLHETDGEQETSVVDEGDRQDTWVTDKAITADFRALGLTIVPAGMDGAVIKAPGCPPVSVSRFTAECLVRCDTFRPLAEHAASIAAELRLGSVEQHEMYRELLGAAKSGLLTIATSSDVSSDSGKPAIVDALVLSSANRPASAKRCLEGFIANAREHGRTPEWVLYDDSADPAVRSEYREMLAALSPVTGAEILYGGQEEKQSYAAALEAEGLDRETVRFCLFGLPVRGIHYGCNRNAMFLDMNGSIVVSQDDDTICETGLMPEASAFDSPRVRLASGDATVFNYFEDGSSARTAPAFEIRDYLGMHELLLGRTGLSCLTWGNGTIAGITDDATDRLVRSVMTGKGRVMATQTGIAGDSGMGSTFYYLLAKGESHERLVVDEASYKACMASRAVVRRVPSMVISDTPSFMTYAVGFDCSKLLPPFMPMLRNSDGLFGALLPLLQPDGLFGLLPWTIGHEPPERRSSDEASRLRNATGMGAADYMAMLCHIWPTTAYAGLPAASRFRSLGTHLVDIGTLPPEDFAELLSGIYTREKAHLLGMLETVLDEYSGAPEFWAGDVRSAIREIRGALPKRESAIPADIAGSDCDTRLRDFATLVCRYGTLLSAWPDMVHVVGTLRAHGVRIAGSPRVW